MGRTSLVVQLLRLCVPNAGDEGMGLISDGENPICSVAKPSPPPPEKKLTWAEKHRQRRGHRSWTRGHMISSRDCALLPNVCSPLLSQQENPS